MDLPPTLKEEPFHITQYFKFPLSLKNVLYERILLVNNELCFPSYWINFLCQKLNEAYEAFICLFCRKIEKAPVIEYNCECKTLVVIPQEKCCNSFWAFLGSFLGHLLIFALILLPIFAALYYWAKQKLLSNSKRRSIEEVKAARSEKRLLELKLKKLEGKTDRSLNECDELGETKIKEMLKEIQRIESYLENAKHEIDMLAEQKEILKEELAVATREMEKAKQEWETLKRASSDNSRNKMSVTSSRRNSNENYY